jgi:phosphonate transport system substrate-binding protein
MKRRHFLWGSFLFVSGCTAAVSSSNSSDSTAVLLPEKLRFAITDVTGLEELQRDYEPFRLALAEVLNTEVEFFSTNHFLGAVSALQSDQVDLVWAGPSEYVVIHARTEAIPIINLTRSDYYTVIAVRANSGIKTLTDLKGKTIDMWKLGSNAAHLGGIKLLINAGLNAQTDFKVVMTEDDSLNPLKNKAADAWVRPIHKYKTALKAEAVSEQIYPIIAQGKQFPGDVFVLSSQLAPELATAIQFRLLQNRDKLLKAIQTNEGLSTKFKNVALSPASDANYDMIREAYKAIGQDDFIY